MTRFHPYYTQSVNPTSPPLLTFTSPLPPAPSPPTSPNTPYLVNPQKHVLPQLEDLPIAAMKKQKVLNYSTTNLFGIYGMELAAATLSITSLKYAVPIESSVPLSLGQETVPGVSVGFIPPFVIVPPYAAFPTISTSHSPYEDSSTRVDLNAIPLPTRRFFRAICGSWSFNPTVFYKNDDAEHDDQILM
jgi:hypothetical protein